MSITVFKPQHVRWLQKPVTLWAVWEGIDGKHHEETLTYRDSRFYGECIIYIAEEARPLLDRFYMEDPNQVLPGTLLFIRIEDLLKLYRYVDHQGNTYAIHWDGYTQGRDRFKTLNGFELNMYSTEFDHIIYPLHVDTNNHLEPDEWADDYDKMPERSRHE